MNRLFFGLILAAATPLLAQSRGVLPAVVPLIDAKTGFLLGGSRGGKWLPAKSVAPTLQTGAALRVFSVTKNLGMGRAAAPKSQGAPCPDTLFSSITPASVAKNGEFALGGAHNPLRRVVQREATSQTVHRSVVAAILKSRGIAQPIVQIQQIWRVDLDGDGAQEVLLTAARKEDYGNPNSIGPASRAGDYSLLLLRRLVRGRVQNIVIEGAFYPRAKVFNAPSFTRLAAVLDADGNGTMEILVRGRYYEGEWTSLYAVEGAKAREVLSEGCGA